MYWADGANRTPPVMFTYNTLFKDEAAWKESAMDGRGIRITKIRRENIDHFENIREEHSIASNQVMVLKRKKRTTYCRESADILIKFFAIYKEKLPKGCVIFRDAGDAYKGFCDEMLHSGVVSEWIEYEPSVHEFLSPNDNPLHGIAKQRWRKSGHRGKDDVLSSMKLLKELGDIKADVIKGVFIANFFLDSSGKPSRSISQETVSQFLGSRKQILNDRREHMFEARNFYIKYSENKTARGQNVQPHQPLSLGESLDGEYWNLLKKK